MPTGTDHAARQRVAVGGVVAVYIASAAVLAATGTGRIRYSADHDRTIGLWEVWIPVAAALLVARLEHLYPRWTAIGAASLLWAGWHVAIHGTGRPLVDAATVVVGLLLGYLWPRFRNAWPVLAIHAAINTPLDLLATV